jgi:methyl-accepting chemotaxis protein
VIGPILWYLSIATIPVVIVTSGIIGYLLLRRIELPLANFSNIVETIGKGDFTGRMPSDIPEALPDVFNEMAERLEKTFESLRRNVESLRFDVETIDSLTKGDSLALLMKFGTH